MDKNHTAEAREERVATADAYIDKVDARAITHRVSQDTFTAHYLRGVLITLAQDIPEVATWMAAREPYV